MTKEKLLSIYSENMGELKTIQFKYDIDRLYDSAYEIGYDVGCKDTHEVYRDNQ
jgi:hypothetical protein